MKIWEWRRLHIEELYSLNCSPNIGRVIVSRRLKWALKLFETMTFRLIFEAKNVENME
jgi:hypothetical protein